MSVVLIAHLRSKPNDDSLLRQELADILDLFDLKQPSFSEASGSWYLVAVDVTAIALVSGFFAQAGAKAMDHLFQREASWEGRREKSSAKKEAEPVQKLDSSKVVRSISPEEVKKDGTVLGMSEHKFEKVLDSYGRIKERYSLEKLHLVQNSEAQPRTVTITKEREAIIAEHENIEQLRQFIFSDL